MNVINTPSAEAAMARRRPAARLDRIVRRVSRVRELGLLVVFLAIVVIVTIQVPRFFSLGNFSEILLSVSIIAIIAVGQTLVILTRNVDLSVGSIVGISAYIVADLLKQHPQTSVLLVILLGCALGLGLGAINGLLVTAGRVPAIVTTLGTLYIYRGIDFLIARGKQISAYDVPESFLNLATIKILGVPLLIIFAAVIALIFAFLLRYTRQGRQLYAIGSNPDAARLVGIHNNVLIFGAFLICGLLAGFAGVLWAARFATIDARAATSEELLVIAAVVVGGVNIFGGSGTVLGAVLGAIVLGTIDNSLTLLKLSQFWLQAIYGAAIIVAVTTDALITRRIQKALISRRQR
jgi:rhamnose transport system permease protein